MSVDIDTLIVGSGFAGLSVASRLPADSFMVIDRGEPFDYAAIAGRYRLDHFAEGPGLLSQVTDAELVAIGSSQTEPTHLPLSGMSVNVYANVMGGISNFWGGYAARVTRETFERDGIVSWPLTADTLEPYYEEAERLLSVHGDPQWRGYSVVGEIPGWERWKDLLRPWFPTAHVTPEAKNISGYRSAPFGICLGNGHCPLCPNDAKARPATSFPEISPVGGAKVSTVSFEGNRAVAAQVRTRDGDIAVSFNKLVLCAGGLENVAILNRSRLPRGVPTALIGRHYQDHTAAEIIVEMPVDLPRLSLGAESHVELPELSGYFEGIEIKALFLSGHPQAPYAAAAINDDSLDDAALAARLARLGAIYLQIEMPPEWDMSLVTRGENSFIDVFPYLRNSSVIDRAVEQICDRIRAMGLRVGIVAPHYRSAFGGHHYSGTTPMSRGDRAVVDSDHRLIGTDNVFLNGASVMPRCGGSGPTLSLVALGLRLGERLA
jgi:choline dehydrogenase-like flavoprotein